MARLEEIQAKIEQNQAALRDILAKRGADGRFPDDVKEQLKRAKEEYAALKEDAENERIAAKLEQELALSEFHQRTAQTSHTGSPENRQNTDTTYDRVFWRHMTRSDSAQPAGLNADERRLLETRGTNTQITTTDSLGGYLLPTQFSNQLENMMKYYSNMMEYCFVADDTQMGGGTLEWPTGDDTPVTGNINTAGNQAAQRTVSDLTFGQVLFNDWLIDSNIIKVSRSLMQDERVGLLQNVLAENLANRIGRKANTVFTTGTGTNQPYGLTTTVTNSMGTSASATAITKSELINAMYSVDRAYRTGPKVGWMMHDTILGYLRTLDVSTDTAKIFVPGNLLTGEPDRLLGYPIFINNDLTGTTNNLPVASTKHIYFGDFSKFVIRKIRNIAIERNDYLYWDYLTVGFMGWMRADSNLINANAIKSFIQHS